MPRASRLRRGGPRGAWRPGRIRGSRRCLQRDPERAEDLCFDLAAVLAAQDADDGVCSTPNVTTRREGDRWPALQRTSERQLEVDRIVQVAGDVTEEAAADVAWCGLDEVDARDQETVT